MITNKLLIIVVLLCSFLILKGCSSSNNITQLAGHPENAAKLLKTNQPFRNMYYGNIPFPANCEQDCYQPHPLVDCKVPAEQCRYTGPQQIPELKSSFNVHWLGHASFNITTPDGQHVLLDPVTGQFDWPVSWAAHLTTAQHTAIQR